uniref:VHS domain-containing protein n=1 Tax=Araucaria cunninghamii TaxID=56994 RepID=A0A0D6QRT5_ARACU
MGDNLMEKFNALGERLKEGGAEVGRKMSAGMSSVSGRVKELFQAHANTPADKMVDEATADNLADPDWASNLEICDMINADRVSSQDVVRAIKKRIMLKTPRVQYLSLVLLETCAKNCDQIFSEIAAERVLDEMVKMIDDPQTIVNNRDKALILIEAWGESSQHLRFLPVFEETYKSLKSRGIRFPGRDNESLAPIFTPPQSVPIEESTGALESQHPTYRDVVAPENNALSEDYIKQVFDVARNSTELLSTVLTSSPQQDALKDELTATLVEQCRQSQSSVQRLVERAGENEALLFEALNVNDEILRVLSKYEDMMQVPTSRSVPEPAMIPVGVEEEESPRATREDALIRNRNTKPTSSRPPTGDEDVMADLDEMIFGKKGGKSDEHNSKKQKDDDLISF